MDYFIGKSTEMEGAYELDGNCTPELVQAILGVLLKTTRDLLTKPDFTPTQDDILDYIKRQVDEEIEMNEAVGDYRLASSYYGVKPDLSTKSWAAFAPMPEEVK